ncbi:hypothetical protein [Bifidobacterium platyrrhinorum]|uniref:hypothetical protein n=1 Tax=Bifidobacterium platyrrhinorum TaxID=2661628 RepID=UPI00177E664B|nr:hypothetical protein [Bifidobacterium platyrrhinorum]
MMKDRRTKLIAIVGAVACLVMLASGVFIGYGVAAWQDSRSIARSAEASASGNGSGTSGSSGSSGSSSSSGSGGSSSSSSGSSSSSASPDSAAGKAMFKEVAGNYSWSSSAITRTDLTLRSDGTFNAAYTAADDENAAHLNSDTPSSTVNITGRFSSIRKTDAGYELQCDADSLTIGDRATPADQRRSGMKPCGTWQWYSGGTTLGQIRDETGAWGVGGLDPSRKAVALASDHGADALFLRMS